ncbi:MAG: RidA family protein [Candidatus Baltobacteraceae bacterium]
MRQNVRSGSPWEDVVGYSRAVRVGNHVAVAGTTAPGADAYDQTKNALAKVGRALEEVGASFEDVVRTRLFVTDIAQWEAVGRAHAEVFAKIKPAATMVEVSRLIGREFLVEIEVDAIIS